MKLKLKIKLKKIIPYGLLAFYLFFTIISFIYTPPKHNITRKELEEINQKNRQKQNDKKSKNNPQLIQSSNVADQQNNQTVNEPLEKEMDSGISNRNQEHIQLFEFQCYNNKTSIYDVFFIEQQILAMTFEKVDKTDQIIESSNQIWKQFFLYEYLAPSQQTVVQNYSYNQLWKEYFPLTCYQMNYYYLDGNKVKLSLEDNFQYQQSKSNNHNQIWKQYFFYSFSNLDEINITNTNQEVFISQTQENDKKCIINDEDQLLIQNDQSEVNYDQQDPIDYQNQSELNISQPKLITEDQFYVQNNNLSQTELDSTIIEIQDHDTLNQKEQEDNINQQVEEIEQQLLEQDQEVNQNVDKNQSIDNIQEIYKELANQGNDDKDLIQQLNESLIIENTTIQNIDQIDDVSKDQNASISLEPLVNLEYMDNKTLFERQPITQCEPTQDDENYDITFLVILILITHIIIFVIEKSKKQNQLILQEEDNMLTHELFELSVIFQEFIKFQKVYNENVLLSQALLEQYVPYID